MLSDTYSDLNDELKTAIEGYKSDYSDEDVKIATFISMVINEGRHYLDAGESLTFEQFKNTVITFQPEI